MKVVNHSSGLRGVGIWRQGNRAYWRCRVQSKFMWFSKLFPFTENGKLKAAKMYYVLPFFHATFHFHNLYRYEGIELHFFLCRSFYESVFHQAVFPDYIVYIFFSYVLSL